MGGLEIEAPTLPFMQFCICRHLIDSLYPSKFGGKYGFGITLRR